MDLSKAFDTVDHVILCKKLEMYDIRGKQLSWCKSYFSYRSPQVLDNNQRSKPLDIVCGVLPGSVLGPLFFILYVNDILRALYNCTQMILCYQSQGLTPVKLRRAFSITKIAFNQGVKVSSLQ